MIWPDPMEKVSIPNMSGSSCSPGDRRRLTAHDLEEQPAGRLIAPNIAKPMTKPDEVGHRERPDGEQVPGGRTGSTARRSTRAEPRPIRTTPATPRPMIGA